MLSNLSTGLYNSSTTLIYQIATWLVGLAGFACVLMIVISCIKIMTGDEHDSMTYLRRIKNGLIAFILILTITSIATLTYKYFPVGSSALIGDFSKYGTVSIFGDFSEEMDTDETYVTLNGYIYVHQEYKKIDVCKSIFKTMKIWVDGYSAYNGGSSTVIYVMRFRDSKYSPITVEYENKWQDYAFYKSEFKSRESYEETNDDFDAFMQELSIGKVSSYNPSTDNAYVSGQVVSETTIARQTYDTMTTTEQEAEALTIAKKIKSAIDGGSTYEETVKGLSETEYSYWTEFLMDNGLGANSTSLTTEGKEVLEVFGCSTKAEFIDYMMNN